MSKYQFTESDIYLPGTDIPVNRLEVDDPDLLHEIESNLLQQAYQVFIDELTGQTRFDEAYFKSLHQRTFSALYDWAGRYRTVDMAKGGSLFCRAAFLDKESARLFAQLEHEGFLKDAANKPTIVPCSGSFLPGLSGPKERHEFSALCRIQGRRGGVAGEGAGAVV